MGFLSDVFSGIGSFLSEGLSIIVDGLSGIARTIGDAIKTMCETLGSEGLAIIGCIAIALLIPGFGLPEILALIQVVGQIAKSLGVGGEDSPEELGMKAEIAEKKPEDFDKIEDYIKYLNEDVELDKDAVEKLNDEEKAKYGAMGAALNVKAIEEKYNISLSPEFLRDITIMKLEGEEVAKYIKGLKEKGVDKMQDMTGYLREEAIESEKTTVHDGMIETMKELYPEKTPRQLEAKLTEMEKELRNHPIEE